VTPRSAIVVGGGLAGISAALDLADAGVRVTLLEVRPRLGGAAYSFEHDELEVDNGQHVFLRCCTEYRALLERLGVVGDTVLQERLSIPVLAPDGTRATLRRSGLRAPLHLVGSLASYPFLSGVERLRTARVAIALSRLDREDPAHDERSFGDWLRDRGESPAAVEALWDLLALPTLNLHANEASLALAATVFQIGLLESADAGDVGYARVPLSRLHSDPAERALRAAGVEVRTRTRVQGLVTSDAGVTVTSDAGPLDAERVVLAVPHMRAAGLLPPGAVDQPIEQLGSSPIVNLHVVYDRRVTELPFAAGVRTPVQWLFDRTQSSGLKSGQHLAISLSGARGEMDRTNGELRERFLPALEELLPGAREATVRDFFVVRENNATFRSTPGVQKLRPGARTRVKGIFLAGAWTDTGWPATMEGAVRSGHAAAQAALSEPARAAVPMAEVA
jgi:squalene-associated FAD-dependent desaturase